MKCVFFLWSQRSTSLDLKGWAQFVALDASSSLAAHVLRLLHPAATPQATEPRLAGGVREGGESPARRIRRASQLAVWGSSHSATRLLSKRPTIPWGCCSRMPSFRPFSRASRRGPAATILNATFGSSPRRPSSVSSSADWRSSRRWPRVDRRGDKCVQSQSHRARTRVPPIARGGAICPVRSFARLRRLPNPQSSLGSRASSRLGTAASESMRYVGIPASMACRAQSFVPL